jgi:hypothetical protein
MGDPVSAGVVGSVILPELGVGLASAAPTLAAASIPTLAGAGALAAPFAASPALGVMPEFSQLMMSGNPLVSALGQGQAAAGGYGAGGESLFGFDTTGGGIGQGIMEQFGQANKFMNQNPITTQLGMKAASSLMPQQQPIHYAPSGQISRGQVQPMDYMSLLNPQQQSVIRPPQISLLG